jgi:hypothetical protein
MEESKRGRAYRKEQRREENKYFHLNRRSFLVHSKSVVK